MFKEIFDNANDGILLASIETRKFVMANQTICNMLGYSEKEILRLGVSDIHPKEDLEHIMDDFGKQVRLEISVSRNIPVKRKDGSLFYADINSKPIAFEGKNYLIGIFRDVTEQKKAREELHKSQETLKSVFESSPDAITVTDLKGRVVDCNPATLNLHGFSSKQDIIGKSALDLISPNDHKKAMENLEKTLETGAVRDVGYSCLKKDGSEFFAELSASLINDGNGEPKAFVGITTDITERKIAEEKIKKQLAYQHALFRISNGATSVSDSDRFIDLALEEIGKAMDAYNVSLYMIEMDQKKATLTHKWSSDNSSKSKLKNLNTDHFSEYISDLVKAGVVMVSASDKGLSDKMRSVLNRLQAKSALGVPINFKNSPAGYLGIDDTNERNWGESDITFLRSASQVVSIYLENKIVQDNLNERMLLSNLVSRIALKFMSSQPFEKKIDYMLSRIGSTLGASRTYIIVQSKDRKYWGIEHTWSPDVAEPASKKLPRIKTEHLTHLIKKLDNKEILSIKKIIESPGNDELKKILAFFGSRGGLAIPIHANNKLWGCLEFDTCKNTEEWKEEDLILLLTLASMVGWLVEKEKPKI